MPYLRPGSSGLQTENQAICAKRTRVRVDKSGAMSDYAAPPMSTPLATPAPSPRRTTKKPRCEDCFFHQNLLCALEEKTPCPTFRPAHPDGLRPPRQLAFVFRHQPRIDSLRFEPTRA
jgi:hypothetical protein